MWGAAYEKPHDESLVGVSTKTSRAAAKRMRGGAWGQVTQASLQEFGLDSQDIEELLKAFLAGEQHGQMCV